MSRPTPPLSRDELPRLAEAVRAWAENHPDPERPIFGFADGSFTLSPRGIEHRMNAALEGMSNSEIDNVLWLYGHAAAEIGLEELIERLLALSRLRPTDEFLQR